MNTHMNTRIIPTSIPALIVQGRYDAVCPIISADDLHSAWPAAQYVIVPDAGHSAWEPGICAELVKATEKFKSALRDNTGS